MFSGPDLRTKISDKLMEPSAYMVDVQCTLQPASIPKSAKTAKNSEFVKEIEKEFHIIEKEMDNMLSHPNCREILQEEEVKMHMSDKLWTSMLPRINTS